MAKKKVDQRAPKTQRGTTLQTKPALELDDIDRLSRIELRLRYVTDILSVSRPDVYTFMRPVWDDLEQFQGCLLERWNEAKDVKAVKEGTAT
jgi:hypothetical protein